MVPRWWWILITQLIALHCGPGDNILVLGSGTGSDVIGGIRCGCNVYGVERDRVQYDASVTRLTISVNERGAQIVEEAKEAEKAKSNKRQKVVHTAEPSDEYVPPTQQTESLLTSNLNCPSCDTKFQENEDMDVCCAEECEGLWQHKTCLIPMNDKLYCSYHCPT